MNISEKNETKAMHRISSVAMTTVTFQNGRRLIFNPIYFANYFGDPIFFPFKHLW